MPSIYLSPSTQEYNLYVNGGSEEEYMNLIADAMEPYLFSSGISFTRNTPDMTAFSSIRESNRGSYDLHLALHSNAAPPNLAGQLRGSDVYYYPSSVNGKRAADIIVQNLKDIYPDPSKVRALPTTTIGEVRLTRAPAVLIEFAYHDNYQDASWIKGNIDAIAANVVLSLTEYFDIPFLQPQPVYTGTVTTTRGATLYRLPSLDSFSLLIVPRGATVNIRGQWEGWYLVDYNGTIGYAQTGDITV